MSLRQVKKILQRKEEPDEESEEEEILTKKNLFNDLEFEELDSDDENEVVEKVAVIIKNTKKLKTNEMPLLKKHCLTQGSNIDILSNIFVILS